MDGPAFYELHCGVNNYEWGKIGSASSAARIAYARDTTIIEETKPYAELWMGTHASLPSIDISTGKTLQELIAADNSALGPSVINKFGPGRLPFLFKVLSIEKALSIQAHPDKSLAEILHSKDPSNYPDDNHKPEMAIAITKFTGLCGFRPFTEIKYFLKNVEPLYSLIGAATVSEFVQSESEAEQKEGLRTIYGILMKSSPDAISKATRELVQLAVEDGGTFLRDHKLPDGSTFDKLIVRLNEQFPSDVGIFSCFFLNYIYLEPGEAVFLQANEPHAYLTGDIVECMAASDNVVRAGFTPKFKDVETLLTMLTYRTAPMSQQKMTPVSYPFTAIVEGTSASSLLYDPPIEEFAVIHTRIWQGAISILPIPGPSIILFVEGEGCVSNATKQIKVQAGTIVFVGAGHEIAIDGSGVNCYRAFCSLGQ